MGTLLRYALLFLLVMLVLRAFGRLLAGLIEGATPPGPRRSGPPDRGVQMVRDPVCGTFLPPASAVSIVERDGAVHYFCSDKCRKAFKERA
jgi:uncharacterized protein